MLSTLSKQYLGKDYSHSKTSSDVVSPADIAPLSIDFPLCMRTAQEALTEKHHLRHGARMQYGLFLKGIGLSLEDALLFWKTEFTKVMQGDKVWKERERKRERKREREKRERERERERR